jgi:hypothetical protein
LEVPLVGLLSPSLGGVLLLICPRLGIVSNPGCKLPSIPMLGSASPTLASTTGGLPPSSMLPGLLLVLLFIGLVVWRRRSQNAQGPPAAEST